MDFGRNFFWTFVLFFLQKCEKCFLRTDTNTSIEKIFFEKFSSKFFGIRSKHFLTFGKNSTERLSELFSTSSKICWRDRLFQFFFLFVVQSDFKQKFSDMWLRNFHKAVKSGSYVFRRPFWWKKNYFESCFFSQFEQFFFLTFVKKYSATLAEGPSKRLDEHFDVQQFLLKKLFFFWILVEIFSEFSNYFFAKLWKVFSKNWCEHFNQKNLFWKFLKLFRNRILTFFDFRQKFYGKIVRTVFYVCKNMLKKQTFSVFFSFRCVIGLWAKLFQHLA